MNKYERIGTLMFRYARRELTRREKRELSSWRCARPDKENLFKNSTDPEYFMVDVGAFLSSKEKGLQKLKDCYPDIWKESPDSRHIRRYGIFGMAADALIDLGRKLRDFDLMKKRTE